MAICLPAGIIKMAEQIMLICGMEATLDIFGTFAYLLQCFDAVGWVAGRASGL